MDQLGFPTSWVVRPIIAMVGFVAFFVVLSAIGLQFVKKEITIARARLADSDLSAGKEKMAERAIPEVRAIDVGLDSFRLDLDKRTMKGKKLPRKTILVP